jgi:hypothetical protein
MSAWGERNLILSLSLSTLAANSLTDSVHQLRVEQPRHSGCRCRSPSERQRGGEGEEGEGESQPYHTTRPVLGKLNYGASSPESHHCVRDCSSSVPSSLAPLSPCHTHYGSNSMGPDSPLFCAYVCWCCCRTCDSVLDSSITWNSTAQRNHVK